MKKLFVLLACGAIVLTSCKGHGPLCPAYSSVKKASKADVAVNTKTPKEKAS